MLLNANIFKRFVTKTQHSREQCQVEWRHYVVNQVPVRRHFFKGKSGYFSPKKLVFKNFRQVLFLKLVFTRIKLLKTEKKIFVSYTLKFYRASIHKGTSKANPYGSEWSVRNPRFSIFKNSPSRSRKTPLSRAVASHFDLKGRISYTKGKSLKDMLVNAKLKRLLSTQRTRSGSRAGLSTPF